MDEKLLKNIEAILNLFVRPQLASHDGDIEVLELDEEGILWIEMQGQCSGCPSAGDTVKKLIEAELMRRIPQIRSVEIDSGISDEIFADAMKLMTTYPRPNADDIGP